MRIPYLARFQKIEMSCEVIALLGRIYEHQHIAHCKSIKPGCFRKIDV